MIAFEKDDPRELTTWRSNPAANLYNEAGLPVVPFRSDAWAPDSVSFLTNP